MRVAKEGEDLTGKVCVASTGRVAQVIGRKDFDFGGGSSGYWVGIGYDGKGTWASKRPIVLFDDPVDYHDMLMTRFGGKMSFNG